MDEALASVPPSKSWIHGSNMQRDSIACGFRSHVAKNRKPLMENLHDTQIK